jgi:DNA-binding transcriptional LysR family regulator
MWRYDDIAIITEVITQGSFIGAAKKLNIPSSTISRRVAQLESQLQVRLLERNAKNLCLTEKGEKLFVECAPYLQKIKASITGIAQDNAIVEGNIKITAPVTLANELLNDWFCEFSVQNKNVNLNINLTNHFEDILENNIDIAFRVGPLKDSQFIGQFLFSTEMIMCVSTSYLKDNKILTTQDLNNQQWLLYNSDNNSVNLVNKLNQHPQQLYATSQISSNNTQILKQACIKGLGIACLPKTSINQALKSKVLVQLLPQYTVQQSKDIYMVYPSNKYLSAKMTKFIEFIKQQVAQM